MESQRRSAMHINHSVLQEAMSNVDTFLDEIRRSNQSLHDRSESAPPLGHRSQRYTKNESNIGQRKEQQSTGNKANQIVYIKSKSRAVQRLTNGSYFNPKVPPNSPKKETELYHHRLDAIINDELRHLSIGLPVQKLVFPVKYSQLTGGRVTFGRPLPKKCCNKNSSKHFKCDIQKRSPVVLRKTDYSPSPSPREMSMSNVKRRLSHKNQNCAIWQSSIAHLY